MLPTNRQYIFIVEILSFSEILKNSSEFNLCNFSRPDTNIEDVNGDDINILSN